MLHSPLGQSMLITARSSWRWWGGLDGARAETNLLTHCDPTSGMRRHARVLALIIFAAGTSAVSASCWLFMRGGRNPEAEVRHAAAAGGR